MINLNTTKLRNGIAASMEIEPAKVNQPHIYIYAHMWEAETIESQERRT